MKIVQGMKKMLNKSLWERCHINCNFEEDKFVGLKMNNDNITVSFPLGYHFTKEIGRAHV